MVGDEEPVEVKLGLHCAWYDVLSAEDDGRTDDHEEVPRQGLERPEAGSVKLLPDDARVPGVVERVVVNDALLEKRQHPALLTYCISADLDKEQCV